MKVDGDGFLTDPTIWTREIMVMLASADGLDITEEHIKYITDARAMYEMDGAVPSIRKFAKYYGMDRKAKPLYDLFEQGVMKRIAKYGGLPKPTGCV